MKSPYASAHRALPSFTLSMLTAVALSLAVAIPVAAQSLYMPRKVTQAFESGTRLRNGMPGPNYWQNRGRYTITISTTPPDPRVSGTEQITYMNNSPDTLPMLVIKLFPNSHKPGAPRIGGAGPDALTSGVHIRSFAVNGSAVPWTDSPRVFTSAPVQLPVKLAPHQSVQLSFNWWYDLPAQPSRQGVIDSTTYYIAYFYPRVAVYDDYNGWDMMDHTGHEFYSDFNDYDVTVNVPANYTVWGTGTLTSAADVLQPAALARYQASFTADSTIHVGTGTQIHAGDITAQHPMNAWHFTATSIPDMAFGLSDHYDWDAGSVLVDDAAHRRASVQAAYNDTAADFHKMVAMGKHDLDYLSHQWPGVPYPYEKTSIFQGGAGMEYPMMVNDESYPDDAFAQFVAAHELAHTYMPFYMGTNETRYAFMDEGWATTFEYLINRADMGVDKADALYKQFRIARWAHDPSVAEDLPIITPSDELTGGYGNNAYGKASLGYLAVKDMLGDALFRKSLHAYMTRWNGKHPTPWDFFYTFDNVAGHSLDWFWNDWYFQNTYIDLGIHDVANSGAGYAVTVDNIGGMDAPFDVVLNFTDGSSQRTHETAAVWERNQKQTKVTVKGSNKKLKSVDIDGGIWMDANTANNSWTAK